MANTTSAQKAQRASLKKRVFNLRHKKAVHDATKALSKALTVGKSEVAKHLPVFQQTLDKAAKHGTISKNVAARLKSRMAKRIAALKK
jgi:small subunit ribosomal protein S20